MSVNGAPARDGRDRTRGDSHHEHLAPAARRTRRLGPFPGIHDRGRCSFAAGRRPLAASHYLFPSTNTKRGGARHAFRGSTGPDGLPPALAPRAVVQVSRAEKWRLLLQSWPLPLIVLGVIGGLYTGAISATEAGAFGAVIALLAAILNRTLTWDSIKGAL